MKLERRPTSLTVDRFTITDAFGRRVTGAVKGSGGVLTSVDDVRRLVRLANRGRPLRVYEPEPFHVAVLPEFSAWTDGPETLVDLRGATVETA